MRIFLSLTLAMMFGVSQAQTATEIIEKANAKLRGANAKSNMTMTIVRPTWSREISMKSWNKGDDYSMIYITSPARDKGTVFLKRDKEIYNWLPNVERVVKLPPSMMMQSWMGSDFTNDDLVQESSLVSDYTHELKGSKTIDGIETWEIVMIPKPESAVVWGKIITYISKDEYLQIRSEFYDEDDDLVNVMRGLDIREIGGRVLATKLEMIPVNEEGQKTIITYNDLVFDVDLDDGFFTQQNMKRIR